LRDAIVVGLFNERLVDCHRIVAGGRAERPRYAADDDLAEDLIRRRALRALAAVLGPRITVSIRNVTRAPARPTLARASASARKFLSDPPCGRIAHLRAQRSDVDAPARR
jgi:hypothetical protein